jgi:hypothetical protein
MQNFKTVGCTMVLHTLAGSAIDDCVTEAMELADRLGIPVMFIHGKVPVFVRPNDSRQRLLMQWEERKMPDLFGYSIGER